MVHKIKTDENLFTFKFILVFLVKKRRISQTIFRSQILRILHVAQRRF